MNEFTDLLSIKTAMKESSNIQTTLQFYSILIKIKKTNERTIVDEICADQFVEWILSTIEHIIEDGTLERFDKLKQLVSILCMATDRSQYFCTKITDNSQLNQVVKSLIRSQYQASIDIMRDVVYIIGNVTCQLEKSYFRNSEIVGFLTCRTKSREKIQVIMTMVRLCTEAEMSTFEELICSIIPDLVDYLKRICESHTFRYLESGLGEILANLTFICKMDKPKQKLRENYTLVYKIKFLLSQEEYSTFWGQVQDLVHSLCTENQILQIENEIKSSK